MREVERERGSLFEFEEFDLRGRVELCDDGDR